MARRDTTGRFNTPLMILAFVSVAGFMYWLSVTGEPSEFTVAQEAEAEIRILTVEQFAGDPGAYLGENIELRGVEVASISGPDAFWFMAEDGTPFLVRLDRALVDGGLRLLMGERGIVTGTVHMMSDSVLDAWTAEGVITDEGQRGMMEFAQTFVHAVQVDVRSPQGDGEGGDAGNDNDS
jgi:hypothetical protein